MSTISWKEINNVEYAYDEEGLVVGYIKHPFDCDLCILFFNDYRVGTYITTTHAKQALLKKYNQITLK
jgi:hypothetical protein